MQLTTKEIIMEWLNRKYDDIQTGKKTGEINIKFKNGVFIQLKNTDSIENLQELIKKNKT